jgi:Mg-chelatase subunit ChlD
MLDEDKIGSLKNAVNLFCDTVEETGQGKDRIGFVRYSTSATLETSLTYDVAAVKAAATAGSAGGYTNIGGGMQLALQELTTSGRSNAKKMILLLTDGRANRPSGVDPVQFVRDQAVAANTARIPILAVSFGSDADQTLMQQAATLSAGVHFHVNTGEFSQSGELEALFRDIAANRNLQLVE